MPIAFTVRHHNHRVSAVGWIDVTLSDFMQYVRARIASDIADFDQLLDLRRALLQFDRDEILSWIMAEHGALGNRPCGRIAVVSTGGTTPETVARTMQAELNKAGTECEVFFDWADAEDWLSSRRASDQLPNAEGGAA